MHLCLVVFTVPYRRKYGIKDEQNLNKVHDYRKVRKTTNDYKQPTTKKYRML